MVQKTCKSCRILFAWRASKSETELRDLDWQVCSKGRKSGEAGGGVWVVAKGEGTELVPFHHDFNVEDDGMESEDLALQELAAAFVRPAGAVEWVAVMGIYVSNSPHKRMYRRASLNGVLKMKKLMQQKATDEGMKISHFEIVGDLNMRLTKKERFRLEFQDWEEEDFIDDADIRWNDEATSGTYSSNEMATVRQWIDEGFKIVNGRLPYDTGDPTRAPFHSDNAVSILDYVLTDKMHKFDKIERILFPENSDHQILILRMRKVDIWSSLSKPRSKAKTVESITQVKWEKWEECDFCRYNDCLEASFGEIPEIDLCQHETCGEIDDLNISLDSAEKEPPEDILESKIRNAIVFCAIKTEQERLDRKDGIGPDGAGSTDPMYLYLKKIKALAGSARHF